MKGMILMSVNDKKSVFRGSVVKSRITLVQDADTNKPVCSETSNVIVFEDADVFSALEVNMADDMDSTKALVGKQVVLTIDVLD